jgi:hypothetical protein
MRAGTGFWHSNVALESKFAHCAQLWRSVWQRGHCAVALQAVATVSSAPQRTHFTTSRKPGMLKVFGEMGGCPRGVYSFFAWGFCSPRGSRGSSWYPR